MKLEVHLGLFKSIKLDLQDLPTCSNLTLLMVFRETPMSSISGIQKLGHPVTTHLTILVVNKKVNNMTPLPILTSSGLQSPRCEMPFLWMASSTCANGSASSLRA